MNILDIVQNSIRAGASLIELIVCEDTQKDLFFFSVKDNGCGMDADMVARVMDPFVTTRTTRRVGLGISLLRAAAQQTGGDVSIQSEVGVGTCISATFGYASIDRQPLGDMASTMSALISMNAKIDFTYEHSYNGEQFTLDTRELRSVLGEDVPLSDVNVAQWIRSYVEEGLQTIYGGAAV